jgi:hypothetical protein
MRQSAAQEKELFEEEQMPLQKIMENFEDIQEVPPEYDQLMPESDAFIYSVLPTIHLSISNGFVSEENLAYLADKQVLKRATKKSSILASITLNQLQSQFNGEDDFSPEYFLLIKGKFNQAQIDLKTINEIYYKLKGYLNYFFSQHLFITNNPMLNEKNKKLKLVEFIDEFGLEISKELKAFKELEFGFDYLQSLKNELHMFCENRYEILYNYIVGARSLEVFLNK